MKRIKAFIVLSSVAMLGILNFTQSNVMLGISEAYAGNWDNTSSFISSSTAIVLKWENTHVPHMRFYVDSLGTHIVKTDSVSGHCRLIKGGKYPSCHSHGPMKCSSLQ